GIPLALDKPARKRIERRLLITTPTIRVEVNAGEIEIGDDGLVVRVKKAEVNADPSKPEPIKGIYHQRCFFVLGSINGTNDFLFLLDTGASRSALDLKAAAKLSLPERGKTKVEGSAGVVEAKQVAVSSIQVGSANAKDLTVTVQNLSGILAPKDRR